MRPVRVGVIEAVHPSAQHPYKFSSTALPLRQHLHLLSCTSQGFICSAFGGRPGMVNGAVLSCLGLRDIEFAVAMADPLQ